MLVTQLLYYSEADLQPGQMLAEVRKIHEASMRNNVGAGITGALLFSDMWFLQMLEGERATVSDTFCRITQDERHSRVCIVEAASGVERQFGQWSMRLITRDRATEEVLKRFGAGSVFRPDTMSAAALRGLLLELHAGSQTRAA